MIGINKLFIDEIIRDFKQGMFYLEDIPYIYPATLCIELKRGCKNKEDAPT